MNENTSRLSKDCEQCKNPNLKGIHTCGGGINDFLSIPNPRAFDLDGINGQKLFVVGSPAASQIEPRSLGLAAPTDGSDACKKCGGEMRPGQAIEQTLKAPPDFYGDKHGVTLSPGGTGKLIDCRKCSACGWSVTTGITQAQILAAMHEYAWTFQAWRGHGAEVIAKRDAVVALLTDAGVA